MILVRSVADYTSAARALLPRGLIWDAGNETNLGKLLGTLCIEPARIDATAAALLIDAFPATAVDLLDDWEASLGLPDACTTGSQTLAQRQQAVVAKLVAGGGQSRPYMMAVAAAAGLFVSRIEEFRPMCAGMVVGQPIYGPAYAYTWILHVVAPAANPEAECMIRRVAPAHTIVLFAYQFAPVLPYAAITTSDGLAILTTADGTAMLTTDLA